MVFWKRVIWKITKRLKIFRRYLLLHFLFENYRFVKFFSFYFINFTKFLPLLNIIKAPDPILKKVCAPVAAVDDQVRALMDDMLETMYEAPGIGLAASQVDIHEQIVVIDVSEDRSEPLVFINPEITVLDEEIFQYDEGCLSVPGFYETVERPRHVRVKALDRIGDLFEIEPEGLLAVCIQHENDHLLGKLFVDYLSPLKRNRIRGKLEKQHKRKA